jgi:hypothetical protein
MQNTQPNSRTEFKRIVKDRIQIHAAELFWHMRDHTNKSKIVCLNYFSDEAWLAIFEGFKGAQIQTFVIFRPS